MAVCTNVLDWGSADVAWDFAECFDAGEATLAGEGDEVVPDFAREGGNAGAVCFDAFEGAPDDDARKAFVVADSVSAAAKDKDWEIFFFCKAKSFFYFGFFFDINEKLGISAKAHSSNSRNWDVFSDFHVVIIAFLWHIKKPRRDGDKPRRDADFGGFGVRGCFLFLLMLQGQAGIG